MTANRKTLLFAIVLSVILFSIVAYYRLSLQSKVPENKGLYLNSLDSYGSFEKFAGAPLDKAYSNISSVKVVYDLKRQQVFFINSNYFRLHYDFCSQVLGYRLGLQMFNAANYGKSRGYYLANINFVHANRKFVLEFSSNDEIDSLGIADMYEQVSRSSFIGRDLRLLLNNTNTIHYYSRGKALPTCNIGELNKGLGFQAIQEGTCTGRLVVCKNIKDCFLEVAPGDIIVVKGSPVEVPLCKGIISDCFQTPLSHIQVLSHNKKMPSAFLQSVFDNQSVLKYQGKFITLTVTQDTLLIRPCNTGETLGIKNKIVSLTMHRDIKTILPIEQCRGLSNADIGTKARGFSKLQEICSNNKGLFYTPEGAFVIPFYFYSEHLKNAGIAPLLSALDLISLSETRKTDSLLSLIRSAINATPVSADLLKMVRTQIAKNNSGDTYRFRSSSNAEDLLSFSGAGLYDSRTGIASSKKKTIERAIKKVWASMYNYRAYQERRVSNIDENTAGMSILAHRSFPNEDVNGVVITRNIYRPEYPGIVINAQKGDVSAVNPPDSAICEQLILTENRLMNPFSKKVSAKYLSYSSLHPASPLLSNEQLEALNNSSRKIADHLGNAIAWDLEFKFENKRLYFKQVRPYR